MRRYLALAITAILTILFAACTKGAPQNAEMIQPGDKVGDFLITTGEKNVLYPFDYYRSCTEQEEPDTYICKSTVGKTLNVTAGLFDDSALRKSTPTATLDEAWSAYHYELIIEDRPVNLDAFDTIEIKHPVLGPMRFWNVVVVTDKPGQISVSDSGIVDGRQYHSVTMFLFSEP